MSRFRSVLTGVVVSVDDSKDDRFVSGWVPAEQEPKRSPGRPKKSEEK